MARSYFQVYLSYEDPLKSLTYEQIGKIFMAMFQYEKTKEKPDLDPVSDMAFCFIRSQMERDRNQIIHEGMQAMALCRKHHIEAHAMGQKSFDEKYHIYGIRLDAYLCGRLNLKEKNK